MNIPDVLLGPISQALLAELIDVSAARVSQLHSDGTLPAGGTGLQWLHAYCGNLREQAAGREGEGGLSLVQERAALARAQREGIELKNAVLRGEYAPISLLAEVLATAAGSIAERLDHLPGMLKKTCPHLTDADREHVVSVINAARNEWVRATAELVARRIDSPEDDAEPDLLSATADEPRAH